MANVSRRAFIQGAGAVAAALAVPGCDRLTRQAENRRASYSFFNADEAAFIEHAVARLIPADETGPGALEADVPVYIDRQLAGAWGAGARLYRAGPWQSGVPELGYQLPFTPAEVFRNALRAIREELGETDGGEFAALDTEAQDAYLRTLEEEERDLGGVPSNIFFQYLLSMTVEGFFADPIYGGNKDMVGWKLVGFPGAYANYYEFVDQHGITFNRPPMSLAQKTSGPGDPHPLISLQAPVRGRQG